MGPSIRPKAHSFAPRTGSRSSHLRLVAFACSVAVAVSSPSAAAADESSAYQVKDIFPSGTSRPAHLTDVLSTLYFTADDPVHGRELWKSNGTEEGTILVKDIRPGSRGSFPEDLAVAGGILYFRANDGVHGVELWRSDGSTLGTRLVKDINPAADSSPAELTNLGGSLLFSADNGNDGRELWRSDGTLEGTALLADIRPGALSSQLADLTLSNGRVFFRAGDGTTGLELWKTDGTAPGTKRVRDIRPGVHSSGPNWLTDVSGTLFFTVGQCSGNCSLPTLLFKSDGTWSGTKQVLPGLASPLRLKAAAGKLYFSGPGSSAHCRSLWVSDGSKVGTRSIDTLGCMGNYSMADVGGQLVVLKSAGLDDYQLWKSVNVTPDMELVKEFLGAMGAGEVTDVAGTAYFRADGGVGQHLWRSDGTADGTTQISGLNSGPRQLTAVGGTLFFTNTINDHPGELWRYVP
jgi:ELWxxDGT repeat protein